MANLPSFAIVVRDDEEPQKKASTCDTRLHALHSILEQIASGISVLKQRQTEKRECSDEALLWRRAKEFETRIKRQNFELKQKIQLFKFKGGGGQDSPYMNQALRLGRNILKSYVHYLPLSSNKLTSEGILTTFDLLCSLFLALNGGNELIESIERIRSLLVSKDATSNESTKKLIAELAGLKFGKHKKYPIKNVRGNALLHKRILRSSAIRQGSSPPKASQSSTSLSFPAPPSQEIPSSSSHDEVHNLLSRLTDLESGIHHVLANSSSPPRNSPEPLLDISDRSLRDIHQYKANNPPTKVSDFIQVELSINRILDGILLELAGEMSSPALIFDILRKELL
eukprot:TRINITY_DN3303_c0_g1_i1.p1 TRINITY_DN3303_c0_g1~~TRINITY_DN3303_c0_g1_i1.p1  ORF type:complete len:341 (+),score=67.51 TRINITY_DN3303_c0_g1_i1:697-1719(+)